MFSDILGEKSQGNPQIQSGVCTSVCAWVDWKINRPISCMGPLEFCCIAALWTCYLAKISFGFYVLQIARPYLGMFGSHADNSGFFSFFFFFPAFSHDWGWNLHAHTIIQRDFTGLLWQWKLRGTVMALRRVQLLWSYIWGTGVPSL